MRTFRLPSSCLAAAIVLLVAAGEARATGDESRRILGVESFDFSQEAGPVGRCPFQAGFRIALWLGELSFEGETATEEVVLDETAWAAAEVFGRLDLGSAWALEVGVETPLVAHVNAVTGSISALYYLNLLGEDLRTYLRLGVAVGTFDVDEAPGDFNIGVGLHAGAGIDLALGESLSLNLEARVRMIDYPFDEEAGAIRFHAEARDFGFGLLAGFSYRF